MFVNEVSKKTSGPNRNTATDGYRNLRNVKLHNLQS